MKLVPPRALVAALAVLLLPCALAASAQAEFGLESVDPVVSAPSQGGRLPDSGPLAAAAHPDMAINLAFRDAGDPRSDSVEGLSIDLAPGIVAYVNNLPVCET